MGTVILRLNEGNATVTAHAGRLQSGNPGSVLVTVTGGLDRIGTMANGDRLLVIGHGSPARIGAYSAEQLAGLLAGAGLPSGVAIDLVACQSGSTGAPFALELKLQLVSKKILPSSVSGGTNNMQVKPDGTPFTKTPGAGGTEITSGKQLQNTPWGPRTRNVNPTYKT
jgi:hypothetical protein